MAKKNMNYVMGSPDDSVEAEAKGSKANAMPAKPAVSNSGMKAPQSKTGGMSKGSGYGGMSGSGRKLGNFC